MFGGPRPIAATGIDFGEALKCRRLPFSAPGCFVKGVVSFDISAEITQGQAEIVVWLAVIRIRVSRHQSLDRTAKIPFCCGELASAQMPHTHRVVTTRIAGVAAQSFSPINFGMARRV